jgi:hypothetical protein
MSKLTLMVATAGTIALLTLGTAREVSAQTLTMFHSFTGADGSAPQAGLIFDATGAVRHGAYDQGASISSSNSLR